MAANGTASIAYNAEFKLAQRRVLFILYCTYAGFYLSRKADSVVKAKLHEEEGFSMEDLAFLDTVYLAVYTVALAGSGVFGGYFSSNKLLSGALVLLALTSFLKARSTSVYMFACCQIIHAMCQSVGWPTCIKLIGTWVTENRGFVMGLWTTCQSMGGILGAVLGTFFLTHHTWQWAYLYHIPILLFLSLVVFNFIEEAPTQSRGHAYSNVDEEDDLESPNSALMASGKASSSSPRKQPSDQKISLANVLMIPGVVNIGVAYFFLKFMRYALLMWLPYYYEEGLLFDQSSAGYMSTSFEMGGLVGTPFIGWFSDKILTGRRDLTSACFLAVAGAMLSGCILVSGMGTFLNAAFMFFVGITVIGPDSILSGTIAQDLGSASKMGPNVIGTLAGLINSVGSCGSIFQSYSTAYISKVYGWSTLFGVFVAFACISSGILFRVALFLNSQSTDDRRSLQKAILVLTCVFCSGMFVVHIHK
mmetsp:Transcript_20792/g.34408  ORF Transcript_20792/g.34408 Transcript_20792/m.34408 type:complete len:476 (+) Transcript_20792:226-1653(+)